RTPGQLGARDQQTLVFVVAGRDAGERSDHAGRAVAPLDADGAVRLDEVAVCERGPVREPVLLRRLAFEGLARAPVELVVWFVVQRRNASGEAVRRAEMTATATAELLCPQAGLLPGVAESSGALLPEVAPTDPS